MGLVHQQHEIIKSCQVIEITLSDVLLHSLDFGCLAAANFGVDLRNIEDVDLAAKELLQQTTGELVVIVPK